MPDRGPLLRDRSGWTALLDSEGHDPLQNAINGLDSRTMNLANSAQVQISDETALATDADIARTEASRADGMIPKGYTKVPVTDLFQGATLKLNQYISAIERMAPTPSVLGRAEGANQSGRARQIAAAAGFTELARFFSRAERLEERIYKQMWFRARQFMTELRLLRVTNDAGAKESLQVNTPINRPVPVMGPDGQPTIQPQQVGVQHHLAEMDMEITITTVRQAVTLRQEAIDAMLEFSAKTSVSILDPQFEFLLELSNIPDKAEILGKYNAIRQKAQAQQQQGQAERDQALAQKHLVESHDQAFDLAVKEAAIVQAHHSPAILNAIGAGMSGGM